MNDKWLRKALELNPWHFLWIIVLAAEAMTFCLNALQSLYRWGHVSAELIWIGTIDAFVVSLAVAPVVIYFLKAANDRLRHDIEIHRSTEHALKESEATARKLLDIPIASALLIDGDGTCLDANETFAGRFGKSVPDVIGRPIWDLFPPETKRKRMVYLQEAVRDRKQVRFEDERQGAWVDVVINPIVDERGEVLKSVVFAVDITVRKQAEEELKRYRDHLEELVAERTKALEQLNQQLLQSQKLEAIGLLAGGIAHDFSNILTAIKGAMYLIQKKIPPDSPALQFAGQVVSSVNKANHLAQGLLAFSRKQMFILRPERLNDIVVGAAGLVAPLVGEHIELRTVPAEDVAVMADRNQMEQVLLNLVTNARDAMPRGGRLTIQTGVTDMDEAFVSEHGYGVPGRYAWVSVSDTGAGIDEAIREKIFEPFFTTKALGKGSGLGLAVAYGIVKQHNGFIAVDSTAGTGTTFTIYIPAVASAAARAVPPSCMPAPAGRETLLLAEDDADARMVTAEMLRMAGYEVLEAADGDEAVRTFTAHSGRIDLAILDVRMPKMNGREAYDAMRRIAPGCACLFVSGYTADIIDGHGILEEGLHFISKAALPEDLMAKVREVLDGSCSGPGKMNFSGG